MESEFYATEEEKKELKEKLIAKAKIALEYLKSHPKCGIHAEVNLNVVERLEKEGRPIPYDDLHIEETGKVIIKHLENLRQEIYGDIDWLLIDVEQAIEKKEYNQFTHTNKAHVFSKKIIERIKEAITNMITINK